MILLYYNVCNCSLARWLAVVLVPLALSCAHQCVGRESAVTAAAIRETDLEAVREDCRRLVKRVSWASAGAAAVPVPLLDVVVDVGILMKVLPEINERFGLLPEQIEAMPEETRLQVWKRRAERGSELVGMVVTRELVKRSLQGVGTRLVTRQVTRFIPFGGQIVAATLGYWVMRRLAWQHVDDCFEVALAARGLPSPERRRAPRKGVHR